MNASLLAAVALTAPALPVPFQQPLPPHPPAGAGFHALPESRSINGVDNNLTHPSWGAADIAYVRKTPIAYADGMGAPAGVHLEGARSISNAVVAQVQSIPNAAGVSDFVWQWGQFLDHDIDLTPVLDPTEPFDIPVPAGDPWFDPEGTGTVTIPLDRSYYELIDGVRQQVNDITAWIDASNVYGSDARRALELRTLDGTGRLSTSRGDLLPFNVNGFPNAPSNSSQYFLAGDFRANEQAALTAMHTLFVREHNFWAEHLARAGHKSGGQAGGHPQMGHLPKKSHAAGRLTGDEIYELARAIVGAEMQVITYNEFLPLLLGQDALAPYAGYRPEVDPSIRNVFAAAAYRFGHSMLSSSLLRLDALGQTIPAGNLALAQAFFNPAVILDDGIEPLLRGLALQHSQEIDTMLIDAVRNFLFGPPGAGGFDLASLNIQRGRDHGLASHNQVRRAYGLRRARDFSEVSADVRVQARLSNVYASVDDVDAWVGGLAEDAVPGALVGETVRAVLIEQFEALRDGDRFWYAIHLPPELVRLVEQVTLADVIRRNTQIGAEIADDVFRVGE